MTDQDQDTGKEGLSIEQKGDETIIKHPACVPIAISIMANANGVAISIRAGAGSEHMPAFGKYPVQPDGSAIQTFGGGPGNGGCP